MVFFVLFRKDGWFLCMEGWDRGIFDSGWVLASMLKSSLFLLVDLSMIEPMGSLGESIILTYLVCVYGGPFSYSWFMGWIHGDGLVWV